MNERQYIYYADDDQDDAEFFSDAAAELGHGLEIFSNGKLLVETLCNSIVKPDIIFIDVHMPQSSGPKILQEIRDCSDFKAIPVILITGYAKNSTEIKRYLDAGANYLLEKPTSHQEYINSLSKILNMDWKTYKASSDDFLSA